MGPDGYRQAASFALDDETQTFVELEGGGKDTFTSMMRDGLYSAYTWRVRQFKEGEVHETTIRFTPDGKPYGFLERLKEDAPGAALSTDDAVRIAEDNATAKWLVDLRPFSLVERAQERRPSGRVDHTFTYERAHTDPQRRALPAATRRLRRPADRSHLLRQDSRGVQPSLRKHALGERVHRRRSRSSGWPCSTSSAESASVRSSCCAIGGSSGASRSSGAPSSRSCRCWRRSTSFRCCG